ncbi:DUF1837 domain-containing protein [Oerskovia turbata]|uniref:DUF1837 domain-containing protein n=1 Tax=Oerskovia turbata TaxID=1713 RepID=A0A4Q1L373_9CELL|nr:hypothetical protein [Oerskovia turbata]RXR26107.1 DUF1837 domain-containing protein [Oerskovia turbata]RXR36609.1 DUF1837 domain-containing protein [Oerskovia turbata]TGJ97310.1 DUF1837 domain-containing protein [Actinotalea fermentans ATCC 43279 = JCM 9966 = DSM 3133]
MDALGLDFDELTALLVETDKDKHFLVEVSPESVEAWAALLGVPVRRRYVADEHLEARAAQGIEPGALAGTYVPDNPSVMSGDFGEMIAAFYLASKQDGAIDPLKWRFKNDRNKSAPTSDVVRFFLPAWPEASEEDHAECAEVKSKPSSGNSKPIVSTLKGSETDRSGRLDKTLNWLKELAIQGTLADPDWDEAMRIRFAEHHFDAALIGPVDYNYTTDKAGLLIGGVDSNADGGVS